jgi:hypothetical protein
VQEAVRERDPLTIPDGELSSVPSGTFLRAGENGEHACPVPGLADPHEEKKHGFFLPIRFFHPFTHAEIPFFSWTTGSSGPRHKEKKAFSGDAGYDHPGIPGNYEDTRMFLLIPGGSPGAYRMTGVSGTGLTLAYAAYPSWKTCRLLLLSGQKKIYQFFTSFISDSSER